MSPARSSWWKAPLLTSAAGALTAAGLVGQATSCVDCRVEVEHLANLGDTTGGPGFIGGIGTLELLDDGTILLVDTRARALKRFDAAGHFLATVGRSGRGPGEYRAPTRVLRADSAIELFDAMLPRRTRFGQALDLLSTTPVQTGASQDLIRVGSHYVAPGRRHAPESVGLPLHVFGPEGAFLRSFGAGSVIRDLSSRFAFRRQLATESDTTFWSADLTRFRLQRWSLNGYLLAEIAREPAWFPPQQGFGWNPQGPAPGLLALHWDDDQGLLWTSTAIPADDWREAARGTTHPNQPALSGIPETESYYQSRVEVIHPGTGEVLGGVDIDALVKGFTSDGIAYAEARSPAGEPVVRLWRLTLVR